MHTLLCWGWSGPNGCGHNIEFVGLREVGIGRSITIQVESLTLNQIIELCANDILDSKQPLTEAHILKKLVKLTPEVVLLADGPAGARALDVVWLAVENAEVRAE